MAEDISAQIRTTEQKISVVEDEIRSNQGKLAKCEPNEKAYLQGEISQLREEKILYLREKEQLRDQQRPAGIISLKCI